MESKKRPAKPRQRARAPGIVEDRPGEFEELRCVNCNRFLAWVAAVEVTMAIPCPGCHGFTILDATQVPGAEPIPPNLFFELRPIDNQPDTNHNEPKVEDANAGLGLGPRPAVQGNQNGGQPQ